MIHVAQRNPEKRPSEKQARRLAFLLLLGSFWIFTPDAAAGSQTWQELTEKGKAQLQAQDTVNAESSFRVALKRVRKSKDKTDADVAACMQNLAQALHAQHFKEDAVPLYKKALHLLEKREGKSSPVLLPCIVALGGVFEDDADYGQSLKFYQRACEIAGKTPGTGSVTYADCIRVRGRIETQLGLLRAAEDDYRTALNNYLSQTELASAVDLNELLADYQQLFFKSPVPGKNLSSSLQKELLKDRVHTNEHGAGVEPSEWAKAVSGRLQTAAGTNTIDNGRIVVPPPDSQPAPVVRTSDFAALEKINLQRITFYQRMIEVDVQSLGAEHPSVARDLGGLAAVYLSQKKYEEARPLLERALLIYKNNYGPDAMLVERTQTLLNLLAMEQNPALKDNGGNDDYLKSLPVIPVKTQTLETALRLNDLAFSAYCHGRLADAERYFGWALAATTCATGSQSSIAAACLNDYASVLRVNGKRKEADSMESAARAIIRRSIARSASLN